MKKQSHSTKKRKLEILEQENAPRTEQKSLAFSLCTIPRLSPKTFFKYPDLQINRLLPFYVDDGNLLPQLHSWIFSKSIETELLFIEDNPGLGKSTTPLAAAIYNKVGYTVIQPKVDVMSSIEKKIDNVLKIKFPEGGDEESVIKEMKDVFLHGLIHIFQKCEEFMSKLKTSFLYHQMLNDYDGSTFDSINRSTLSTLATKTVDKLLDTTRKVSKSNHFILHLDEMQLWAMTPFKRDPKRHVFPSDFSKYRLIALSEALLVLKGRNTRFVISGTNIQQGMILRISSKIKTRSLRLPLFSEDGVLQLLDLLCKVKHLNRELLRTKIASYLSGCVRSCEYFFDIVKTKFAITPTKQVTVEDLEKCLMPTYERWSMDIGNRYTIPDNFVNEVLLAFVFPEHLGGTRDDQYPNDAIDFPQKNIPENWVPFAESGAIRLQIKNNFYCLWKPYHFLLKWMKERITIFEFNDLEQLRSEIECGNIAPDKRKGYCFQRAVALELVNISGSKFWKLMIEKISNLGVKVSPHLLITPKIKLFAQDKEVVQNQICMVQDVSLKGVKKINAQRTGDIAGIQVKDDKNNYWKIFIEAKNGTDQKKLRKGLDKFFKHAEQRKETQEIYIYLSYHPINSPPYKSEFDMNNNKLYLIIDDIKKEDFTLDIAFLSNPKEGVTIQQLIEKLSPSISPKITGGPMQAFNSIISKVWVQYGDNKDKIDLSGIEDVADLRKEIIRIFKFDISPLDVTLFKDGVELLPNELIHKVIDGVDYEHPIFVRIKGDDKMEI